MTTDKRIAALLAEIPQCRVLADVGTDHGYLCLKAIEYGRTKKIIATDISAKSLDKAKKMLIARGYGRMCSFRKGDGLSVLTKGEADVIVISGMGGAEIISILGGSDFSAERLVLSPQSDVRAVREWLIINGFRIVKDRVVENNRKFYNIISAESGSDEYKDEEYRFGRDNLIESNPDFALWLKFEIGRVENILKSTESESATRRFTDYLEELKMLHKKTINRR